MGSYLSIDEFPLTNPATPEPEEDDHEEEAPPQPAKPPTICEIRCNACAKSLQGAPGYTVIFVRH